MHIDWIFGFVLHTF